MVVRLGQDAEEPVGEDLGDLAVGVPGEAVVDVPAVHGADGGPEVEPGGAEPEDGHVHHRDDDEPP